MRQGKTIMKVVKFLAITTTLCGLALVICVCEAEKLQYRGKSTFYCPDNESLCYEGNSCCKLGDSDQYGCCITSGGACCGDYCCDPGLECGDRDCCHQAPTGYIICFPGYPIQKQVNHVVDLASRLNTVCDDRYLCPEDSICCQNEDKTYSCCPDLNGVCCANGTRCCPEGHQCAYVKNVEWNCRKPNEIPTYIIDRQPAVLNSSVFICPDKTSACLKNNTCCATTTSAANQHSTDTIYGCCPMENAVCCSDMLHCCPSGSVCDNVSGLCKAGSHMHGDAIATMLKKNKKLV